jgi:ring-1,2-phenylacetyl-CoA epoxidase subunit PaaC
MQQHHKDFMLMLADNSVILGQRLGEWCGHGPVLEQDIALTNIALDLIGEARFYYQSLALIEGKEEDWYPMKRDVRAFKNVLLVEQPNGHFGDTIMRQFLFDVFHFYMLDGLKNSADQQLAALAKKCIKEVTYHLTFSSEWVIRLGDGTEESHQKIQASLDNLFPFFLELVDISPFEKQCIAEGICPDLDTIKSKCMIKITEVVDTATLVMPVNAVTRKGGKSGLHMEYLGYILADMQYLQRVHPGAEW